MRTLLGKIWSARRAVALYAILIALGWFAGEQMRDVVVPEMRPSTEPVIHRTIMTALAVYIVTAAIPFIPGAEIGFALLLLFGGQASFLVYIGMVGALLLAYTAARIVPLGPLAQAARWAHLTRAAVLLDELDAMPIKDRANVLSERMTGRFGEALLRNRFLFLIIVLNLPGNSVLGGGGGIAFMAGLSGLYGFVPYLICVLVSVAPIPLFFYLFGN